VASFRECVTIHAVISSLRIILVRATVPINAIDANGVGKKIGSVYRSRGNVAAHQKMGAASLRAPLVLLHSS
jgi:hypothetical protein